MVKNYFQVIISVVFSFTTFNSFGQNNEAIGQARYHFKYLLNYQPDSTDINSVTSEEFMLQSSTHISKFQSINGYKRDSILTKISFPDPQRMGSLPKSRFREVILKDYKNGKITYRERILSDHFEYEEPLGVFNWAIGQEKQTINGYPCQKATTTYAGRTYEAWFTQEIPNTDGPYKFNGLPGLIVKIYDTKKHYVYELTEVKQIPPTDITKEKEPHITTGKKEFYKVKNEFYDNPIAKIEQMGGSITFDDPNQIKMMQDKLKKRNNPIELVIE